MVLAGAEARAEDGEIRADRLRARPGELSAEGDVLFRWDAHRFQADVLEIREEEAGQFHFQGSDLWWTPCRCDVAPWSLSAKDAEGVLGEHLIVKRAVFRVCDVPVFPVPWLRLPLDPRAPRLLFPEFRFGDEGGVIGQPIWLPMGDEGHVLLTPEVWTQKGVRQRVEIDGDPGKADFAAAKEGLYGPTRGQANVAAGRDDGEVRLAVDASWVSDSRVRNDYADSYLQRLNPFEERLLVAGAGPFRLESDTFDTGAVERPIGAVLEVDGLVFGGASVGGYARLDTIREGVESLQRSAAGIHAAMGRSFDIFDTEARLEMDSAQMSTGGPYARAGGVGAILLPTWSELGKARQINQTGVEVLGNLARGHLDDPLGWVKPRPTWAVGPIHRTTVVTGAGVPFRFRGAILRSLKRWEPSAEIRIDHGGYSGSMTAERGLQGGTIGYADEGKALRFGAVRGADILQGGVHASVLTFPGWRPGWSGLYDFYSGRLLRHGPSIEWDSGCDCLRATLAMEWAQDRKLPTAMFRLDLQPK